MATYKAVMRPALKYSPSIWSPLASSTSINKLQGMQNAALRSVTGCTQDTNIQYLHYETLTLPIRLTIKQKHNIYHIPYTNTQHTSTLQDKKKLFSTMAATQQTFPQTPHSHYNRHKTNMRHIHTSIYCL